MNSFLWAVMAALGLAVTAYAHWRLTIHSRTGGAWIARALMIVAGLGVGYLSMASAPEPDSPLAWFAFLAGFGVAHVPAAAILFIKHKRHEYG